MKCLEEQGKQEQETVLSNSHGAGGPQLSKSLNKKAGCLLLRTLPLSLI